MTLKLTPDILRAAYDYLCETEPFSKWNLPAGEDVVFRVIRAKDYEGVHWFERRKHHISISSFRIARTHSLMEVMAHELIHVHERHAGACTAAAHSAAFNKWAKLVCKTHGFDLNLFY